jgi:hypothetical protein
MFIFSKSTVLLSRKVYYFYICLDIMLKIRSRTGGEALRSVVIHYRDVCTVISRVEGTKTYIHLSRKNG